MPEEEKKHHCEVHSWGFAAFAMCSCGWSGETHEGSRCQRSAFEEWAEHVHPGATAAMKEKGDSTLPLQMH